MVVEQSERLTTEVVGCVDDVLLAVALDAPARTAALGGEAERARFAETVHLLRSPANAARLRRSIAQHRAR